MRIRRAVVVVAFLGMALGACGTDEPEQENTNQGEEQDAGDQDLDTGSDSGGEEEDTGDDAGDDEDVDGIEDVGEDADGPEDVGDDIGAGDTGVEDAGDDDVGGDEDAGDDDAGEPVVEGDSCETAIDVTEGAALVGESTVEMSNHYDPAMGAENCPGTNFSDRERVYVVSPLETTTYEVVAEPEETFDLMLYARQDCDADACVAGTRFNGAGGVETISFEAVGGESVYIFVDGEIGHAGEFDLMVSIEE